MAERLHTKKILMFENALNLRGFRANNLIFHQIFKHQMRICEGYSTKHLSKLSLLS